MSKITVTNNADVSTLCHILDTLNDKTVSITIYTAMKPIDLIMEKFIFTQNEFYFNFRDDFVEDMDFLISRETVRAIEVIENGDTYKFVRVEIVDDIFITVMDIICEY